MQSGKKSSPQHLPLCYMVASSDSGTSWIQLLLTVLFHLPSREMMTYNGPHTATSAILTAGEMPEWKKVSRLKRGDACGLLGN